MNAREALTGPEDLGRDKCVEVSANGWERDGVPWIRISVFDNGPGIPQNLQESVFDPFFTTRDRSARQGLGLATAYSIAQEHGGTLWLETEPGSWTRFHLDIPVECGP